MTGGGPYLLIGKISEALDKAYVAELVTKGLYVCKAETFEEVVETTGRASDSREPGSVVCGAGGPGIANKDGTRC